MTIDDFIGFSKSGKKGVGKREIRVDLKEDLKRRI
jgi:hypothetical protein